MAFEPLAHKTRFGELLGIEIKQMSPVRVRAEMLARPELANRSGFLHGGALMGMADNIGGAATFAALPAGRRTVTLESKTNFLAVIPIGEVVFAECTAIDKTDATFVWQTTLTRQDGKLAAIVTQTQLIL